MPRFHRTLVLVCCVAAMRVEAASVTSCATQPDSTAASPQAVTFQTHRQGLIGVEITARDVEFLWDGLYGPLSEASRATLDNFNQSIGFLQGSNPTATDARNLQAVYNLLRRQGNDWNTTDPADSLAYRVGRITAGHTNADRAHTDLYIYNPAAPGNDELEDGGWPSVFLSDNEDVSSGRALGDVRSNNSVMIRGPAPGQEIDLTGTGWTSPNRKHQIRVLHEIQHSLPGPTADGNVYTELWSAAAEAINGIRDTTRAGEIPYTWPLLSPKVESPPLRGANSNYAARTSFMAYVAYNFLNADSSRTLAGAADDLLVRWAKGANRTLADLKPLLADLECHTCANRTYFRDGTTPLPTRDRLNILHHNWRVANFVNNPTSAERQFGFSTFAGFSPATNQVAWQDFDGDGTDDIVALPAIVSLNSRHLTRDTVIAGMRSFRGSTFPLALAPFAANYWVIRSDAALQAGNRDLVVRVIPTACHDCRRPSMVSFALSASAVGYSISDVSGDESVLWQSPAAVSAVSPIRSLETDALGEPMEVVLPNFGATNRSALLVLSAGDGFLGSYAAESEQPYVEAIPYRLEIGLRSNSTMTTSPVAVTNTPTIVEATPTWSPAGDELAYSARDTTLVPSRAQIYRKKLDGSPAVLLAPQPLIQTSPSWSPRGDAIAFEALTGTLSSSLFIADLGPGGAVSLRQLTNLPGCATMPSFQPNGQGLAYTYIPDPNSPNPTCVLRWVGLDGSGDGQVAVLGGPNNFLRRPRWSPDGSTIYVSIAEQGDRIHAVPRTGGALTLVSAFPTPTPAFDTHPGSGRLAFESSVAIVNTAFGFVNCPAGFGTVASKPATRIGLTDSTRTPADVGYRVTDRALLNRTPALSPSGTFVAYQVEAAGGHLAELHTRRLSWNSPPAFTSGAEDQSLTAGTAFEVMLQALDPDGETVVFKADYLPAGSTLYNGNTFRWQNPVAGTYFPVFRALDGSGGVARQVVKLTVAGGGGSGDPFRDGDGGCGACIRTGPVATFGSEASATLGTEQAEAPANSYLNGAKPGELVTSTARLTRVLLSATGEVIVTLLAPLPGSAEVDRARLLAVDHAAEATAVATSSGIVVAHKHPVTRISAELGEAATARMSSGLAAGDAIQVPAGTSLEVAWSTSTGGSGLALECAHLGSGWGDKSGIEVQVEADGGWRTVDRLHPRRGLDLIGTQLSNVSRARLVFLTDTGIRGVWALAPVPGPGGQWTVHAFAAEQGDPNTSPSSLAEADGNTRELDPGESFSMTFPALPITSGLVRSYFLELCGSYTPTIGAVSAAAKRATMASPSRFALSQNQPNPGTGGTTFRFDVPRASHVRLEVFDLQGRLVAKIVDRSLEPGAHTISWGARDSRGGHVGPGVYLYRMTAGEFRAQRRLVLVAR